jgi:antitoxin HicB
MAMTIGTEDDVRHYLGLPYRIAVTRDEADEETPWRAVVEELPGCEVRGSTPADATARIPAALADWVATAQADGREIPEPRDARNYSGRLLLRMSRSLHSELALAAERDQVSLNAYITAQLAVAVRPQGPAGTHPRPASAARSQAVWWALVINLAVVSIAALVVLALILVGTDGL